MKSSRDENSLSIVKFIEGFNGGGTFCPMNVIQRYIFSIMYVPFTNFSNTVGMFKRFFEVYGCFKLEHHSCLTLKSLQKSCKIYTKERIQYKFKTTTKHLILYVLMIFR